MMRCDVKNRKKEYMFFFFAPPQKAFLFQIYIDTAKQYNEIRGRSMRSEVRCWFNEKCSFGPWPSDEEVCVFLSLSLPLAVCSFH